MKLESLKDKTWAEINEKIHSSPITSIFQREFATTGDRDLQIHLFTTLIKVAWIDRSLSKLEYAYILKKVGQLLREDDEILLKQQFDLVSAMVRKNINSRDYIPWHIAFLAKKLGDNTPKFMDILVGLISADDKMDKREEKFLEDFAHLVGVSGKELQEYKVNCRFRLIEFQKEEKIPEAAADESQPHPEIKLELDF
ncbi:MAG: TerB family tellurite resistance protein [Deltaproteobacteria bacterium]|nr:MAG: TerB family tellurite resistance protein [Deltaproteobacteria bacterium]